MNAQEAKKLVEAKLEEERLIKEKIAQELLLEQERKEKEKPTRLEVEYNLAIEKIKFAAEEGKEEVKCGGFWSELINYPGELKERLVKDGFNVTVINIWRGESYVTADGYDFYDEWKGPGQYLPQLIISWKKD